MLSLQGYITSSILSQIAKKGFLSGRYVLFGEFISNATWAFETGSVVGFTFRNQLSSLTELMAEEGRGGDLAKAIGTFPEARLAKRKVKPKNFNDLFFQSEAIHVLVMLKRPDLIEECESGNYRNAFKLKMPYAFAFSHLQLVIAEGVGFGSQYPELTENLLSFEYDKEEWSFAYKHGLDIGDKPPENIPIPQRQAEIKELIAPFVEEFRPDLLAPLQLGALRV